MKKLALLFGFVFVFALSGCFGDETDEGCWGDECGNVSITMVDEEPGGGNSTAETQEPFKQSSTKGPEGEPVAHNLNIVPTNPGLIGLQPNVPVFTYPGGAPDDQVTIDQLTAEELTKIKVLRDSIEFGLSLGKEKYLEAVSMFLAQQGIVNNYEGVVSDGFADLYEAPEPCPFVKYYDNGFEPTGAECEYLADIAKVEVYSKLSKVLESKPLPPDIIQSPYGLEAGFWYEQGAISGAEEQRVLVRNDLKKRGFCEAKPTPVQSSFEKGIQVGRQLLASKINSWLSAKGLKADYPTMSQPIEVCNMDQLMLIPAKQEALKAVDAQMVAEPLCADYEPPTLEAKLQYSQAKIEYEKGIKEGIESEFALAAVKVFKVIPCNVSDPVVVDLDGDGIELLPNYRGVDFDLYGLGSTQAIAWVSPDDGLLVLDRNGNGVVDDGTELFGNIDGRFVDGFEHLAELDRPEMGGNGDGVLDAGDAGFPYLKIWKDSDTNGVSSADELLSLAALKVTSVKLEGRSSNLVSGGNRIAKVSFMAGETTFVIGDAYLSLAPYPRLASR